MGMVDWKILSYADLGRTPESAPADQRPDVGPALVEQASAIRPIQGGAYQGSFQAVTSNRIRSSL